MKKRLRTKEKNDLLQIIAIEKKQSISIIDINQLRRTLRGQNVVKDIRILPITFTGHDLEIFQVSKRYKESYKSLRIRILKGLDAYNTSHGSIGRAISICL